MCLILEQVRSTYLMVRVYTSELSPTILYGMFKLQDFWDYGEVDKTNFPQSEHRHFGIRLTTLSGVQSLCKRKLDGGWCICWMLWSLNWWSCKWSLIWFFNFFIPTFLFLFSLFFLSFRFKKNYCFFDDISIVVYLFVLLFPLQTLDLLDYSRDNS